MRRRDFIKGIGGAAAEWRARTLVGSTALQPLVQLTPAPQAAAQTAANLPIEIVPQLGHSSTVTSVAFSPDGHNIVSGSDDNTLKIWDVASGRELRALTGHDDGVSAVAFSPDGRSVASGSWDKTLKLWDVASVRELRTLKGHGSAVNAVAFSPDGRSIVSGSSDKTLKLWNATSGRALRTLAGHGDKVWAVAFSPDGRSIASGSGDKTLKFWDATSGRALRTVTGHADAVWAVGYSPDGHTIVSGSLDKTLKLWDAASGRELSTLEGHSDAVWAVVFSPDGHTIVSGSKDKTLKFWNPESGRAIATLTGHVAGVTAVAFSPDGRSIVSGTWQSVKLWDAASERELAAFTGHNDWAAAVAFSPDGSSIVSGNGDKTLKFWDAASARGLRTLNGHGGLVSAVAFSPDGGSIVSGSEDRSLKLWDVPSGRELRTLTGHLDKITAVAFTPDGRAIVSGAWDRTLKLWDPTSGHELRTLTGHSDRVTAVALSPDGRSIVSASRDNTLKLWDVASGHELRTFEGLGGPVAFSPDGRSIVSGSGDNTLKLWDAASGRVLRTLRTHGSWVSAVAFSPDGRSIVSASRDNTLELWDAASGQGLRPLKGHDNIVWGITFSPDGRTIVSGSADGTIRIWNTQTGEEVVSLVGGYDNDWLAITRAGFFSVSGRGADFVGIIRGLEGYSVDQFYQALYRPDVVRQKLSSDPEINARVKVAARNVNLEKILDSGAPPEITIVSPLPDAKTSATSITVEVDFADRGAHKGGGIGRIEWRIDGVTRALRDLQKKSDGAVTKVSQDLALPEGTSVIEMVAYNKANLAASLPAAVSVTSSAPRQKAKLYVLAIAVNAYSGPGVPQLENSIADAQAVLAAFALSKSDKMLYDDVITRGVFYKAVTAKNLQVEFENFSKDIRPDDVFVLYISGHGITDDGRYYLVPYDGRMKDARNFDISTCIAQDQLQQWLTLIPAFKSVLIYDTCESGSNTEDRAGFRGLQQLVAAEKLSRAMGRTVLSASSDVTQAQEGYPPGSDRKHGVFTYVLLDAFAAAKTNAEGRIDTAALADYLRINLPRATEDWAKKNPTIGVSRQEPQVKLSGAPFPLVKRVDFADLNRVR